MKITTPIVVTATELQVKSGQILRHVSRNKAHVIVERGGYPVAAVIPLEEYQKFVRPATTATTIFEQPTEPE